jgi:hypothetical protein
MRRSTWRENDIVIPFCRSVLATSFPMSGLLICLILTALYLTTSLIFVDHYHLNFNFLHLYAKYLKRLQLMYAENSLPIS